MVIPIYKKNLKSEKNAVKPVSKPVKTRFWLLLATFPSIDVKNPTKWFKKNGECSKTGFKPDEHTFSHISLQRYLPLTQKNLKIAKKKTANTVKPVSKPANTCFC